MKNFTEKTLAKFTPKMEADAAITEKIMKNEHEELSDEELQTILDASEKMREKLAQIDDFFKSSKFTNPYGKGGILDAEKWVKSTFTLERVKNGEIVTKTVNAYDCYKSEQYATRLAYQVTMIKIKAACGFYDKKVTTRFDELTYKLYCQRAYLLRLVAAYDEGDLYSLSPLDGKNNAYTDVQVFDLFQEAISHIYACMADGLDVGKIYNFTLNELNKYVYRQSAYRGGIVTENNKQHRKYKIVSLDEILTYIADDDGGISDGILPSVNIDNDGNDYVTIVDSCIQFDVKMRRDLYRCTKKKFRSTSNKRNKEKYIMIFNLYCKGFSVRQIIDEIAKKQLKASTGGMFKIITKIKLCGLQSFKELYPELYNILACTDSTKKENLSKALSQNHGVTNRQQKVEKMYTFIDEIIETWRKQKAQ